MDEIEIANLLYSYAEYIDTGDLVGAARLFEHARVKLFDDRAPLTHEELLAVWRHAIVLYPDGTPKTKHVITNPIIEVDRDAGTATCRSYYTVVQGTDSFPLQAVASGRYHDEFVRESGRWRFSFRDYSLLDAAGDLSRHSRNHPGASAEAGGAAPARTNAASPTRARILAAAQQAFSSVGYSQSGIRKIAEMVDLSSTILLKHFGTKAALFEEAVVDAIGEPQLPRNRERFGREIADLLAAPGLYVSPHAMTVLATGDEEARAIAARVLHDHSVAPLAEWLGPPDAEARARQILALCAGFVLYTSQLVVTPDPKGADPTMVEWLARSLQAVVDAS